MEAWEIIRDLMSLNDKHLDSTIDTYESLRENNPMCDAIYRAALKIKEHREREKGKNKSEQKITKNKIRKIRLCTCNADIGARGRF